MSFLLSVSEILSRSMPLNCISSSNCNSRSISLVRKWSRDLEKLLFFLKYQYQVNSRIALSKRQVKYEYQITICIQIYLDFKSRAFLFGWAKMWFLSPCNTSGTSKGILSPCIEVDNVGSLCSGFGELFSLYSRMDDSCGMCFSGKDSNIYIVTNAVGATNSIVQEIMIKMARDIWSILSTHVALFLPPGRRRYFPGELSMSDLYINRTKHLLQISCYIKLK